MRRFTVEVRYREEVCSQGVATLLTLTFWRCRFFTSFLWIGLSKLRHEVDSGLKTWQLENRSNAVAENCSVCISEATLIPTRRDWKMVPRPLLRILLWKTMHVEWWNRQSSLHTMDCRFLALLFRLRFFRVLGGVGESYGPSAKGRVRFLLTLQHEWYI